MNRGQIIGKLEFLIIFLFLFGTTNLYGIVNTQSAKFTSQSETVFFSNQNNAEPTISTLKIGETIFITGQGFEKFEIVSLSVENYNELLIQNQVLMQWNVYTDVKGGFEVRLPINSLISNYKIFVIKAVGEKSKQETQTTFSSVTPVVVSGNPSCATLNSSSDPAFAHITTDFGFKIDPPASGTFPFTNGSGRVLTGGAPSDAGNSVTISNRTSTSFDWSSTKLISAVIVKGGPNANVYPYNPNALNDTLLTTVGGGSFGISHIEFCFENTTPPASITIIKDAQPNTTQTFNFSATGQITNNFGLVDNGVIGPDRITFNGLTGFGAGNSVTVTESAPGGSYQLTQINCTSTVTNNNNVSVPTRSVEIVLEPGENVTCTFVNTIVTAAAVSVSGQVKDDAGTGISRTLVTIQNTNTGEILRTLTNSFGNYRFDGLEVGNFYIVTVSNRKFVFTPDTRSFTLNDAVDDLDFTGSNP